MTSMSDERYPILVERLTGKQALLIACEACNAEATIGAEDIRNEANYVCPRGCGGSATYKYAEADDRCPNCGKLGFFSPILDRCCSRPCMLQAEYAKVLAHNGSGAMATIPARPADTPNPEFPQ